MLTQHKMLFKKNTDEVSGYSVKIGGGVTQGLQETQRKNIEPIQPSWDKCWPLLDPHAVPYWKIQHKPIKKKKKKASRLKWNLILWSAGKKIKKNPSEHQDIL